ncbi:hypothetical protein RclHR1_21530002 [Rhizophagus clarus]|nr:hypothetical protein RclHR1_21530002 [Rhizophagus clarus]
MAHIINLAVQAVLSSLKVGHVEDKNEILNGTDEPTKDIPKLRKLVNKIHASSQKCEKFVCQYEAVYLPNKELIPDVKTR